ncbi:MAG: hypothetical protein JWQ98_963 [Chlorobi bacterium]|jgi:hypothetical protein|nr:hypothetical protein [Chlorobiota bacterium]
MKMRLHSLSLLAVAAISLAGLKLSAQTMPISVTFDETAGEVTPAAPKEFWFHITNTTAATIKVQITRTVNQLPDTSWSSYICTELCYPPEISKLEPITIKAGKMASGDITITGGAVPDQSAKVTIRFQMVGDSKYVDQDISATAGQPSGVDDGVAAGITAAYPNPATGYVFLPVPGKSPAKDVSLGLYNIRGEQVANLSEQATTAIGSGNGSVRADVTALPVGVYFYRLVVDGVNRSGSVTVLR